MWTTLNISWNVGIWLGNDRVTLDKQNCNLALLFSWVRVGLMAFVCGWRAPSLIRLCMVDLETFIHFARDRILVRRRKGIPKTWLRSTSALFRPTTIDKFEDNSTGSPWSIWNIAWCQMWLTVRFDTEKCEATLLMAPFSNFPEELACNRASYIARRCTAIICFFVECYIRTSLEFQPYKNEISENRNHKIETPWVMNAANRNQRIRESD